MGVDPRAGRLCARASSLLCSPLPASVALRVEGVFASITAAVRATRCRRLRGTTCAAPPRRPRLHPAIASVAEPPLTRPHRGRHSCHGCCHQQASLSRRFTVGDAAVGARGGGRGAGGRCRAHSRRQRRCRPALTAGRRRRASTRSMPR